MLIVIVFIVLGVCIGIRVHTIFHIRNHVTTRTCKYFKDFEKLWVLKSYEFQKVRVVKSDRVVKSYGVVKIYSIVKSYSVLKSYRVSKGYWLLESYEFWWIMRVEHLKSSEKLQFLKIMSFEKLWVFKLFIFSYKFSSLRIGIYGFKCLGTTTLWVRHPALDYRVSMLSLKLLCWLYVLLLINVCVIGSTRCHLLKKQKQHLGRTGNWHLASRPWRRQCFLPL